jgi:hypothetical protein
MVYSIHAMMVSPANAQTLLNAGIIGFCAALAVFYAVFSLSIRIEINQSRVLCRSLLGSSAIQFRDIESVSRFSGRGAGFLKIRSAEKNITISTYSFSSKDLATINHMILAGRRAL